MVFTNNETAIQYVILRIAAVKNPAFANMKTMRFFASCDRSENDTFDDDRFFFCRPGGSRHGITYFYL